MRPVWLFAPAAFAEDAMKPAMKDSKMKKTDKMDKKTDAMSKTSGKMKKSDGMMDKKDTDDNEGRDDEVARL